MTKQLKKIILLSLFGVLIFSFFNCEYDEKETSKNLEKHHSHEKVSRINRNQITSNKRIVEKLLHVNNAIESNKNNRSVYSSEFDFYIDTDFATYIENEDATYHSYTFLITRTNPASDLENLVFSLNNQGEYDALIITYNLNAQEKSLLEDGETVDLTGKVTSQRIDGASLQNDIFNKESATSGNCEGYVAYTYCKYNIDTHVGGYKPDGSRCDGYTYDREYFGCSGYGGTTTTGTTGDSSPPPSGGGSTGSNTTNENDPVITYPTTTCPDCPEIDEEIITPQDLCNDLAAKDANSDFINYMADLKLRAASQNFESAYTMFQNASLGLQFSPRYDGSLQEPEVNIGVGFTDTLADLNSIGAIHCHLDDGTTFKIFSFSDIIALAEFADISTRPTSEFGIYVVTSSGTFCLKIKNKIQLKQMLIRMRMTLKTYEDDFDKHVKKEQNLDTQVLEFLKFLKIKQFGNILELYKKDETNNVWQKQELNSNETTVNPTNC